MRASWRLLLCIQFLTLQSFKHPHRYYHTTNTIAPLFARKIEETQLQLETGIKAQILHSVPDKVTEPPLVFIHGSFHAAWCWAEKYFDYFTSLGYPVAALSLRGTGGTFAGDGVTKINLEEHVADVRSFLEHLPDVLLVGRAASKVNDGRPVLIAHSFGGLTVMKLLELHPEEVDNLSGVITMCSVPPSGNGPMTWRYLRRSMVDSYKITVGFVAKRCIVKDDLMRDLFFGGSKTNLSDGRVEDNGVSDEDIKRYQGYFERDTDAVINVSTLLRSLPSRAAVDNKAPYVLNFPPSLVIGASRDFIVDREGVEETAVFFGLDRPLFVDSPHDIMLGGNWKNGAEAIHNFVQSKVKTQSGYNHSSEKNMDQV